MNLFRTLWNFLTGDDTTVPHFDELDTVITPTDDELESWLTTLSESDKQLLGAVGREIHFFFHIS